MFYSCFIHVFSSIFIPVFRSGLGNHYGTLSGPVPALSPVKKAGKAHKSDGKNVITNPSKKGTGYG